MFKQSGEAYDIVDAATYPLMSLAVTVWAARTLHQNGRIFLVDAFHGNTELADSVNHLLGGVEVTDQHRLRHACAQDGRGIHSASVRLSELVSDKIGIVLLVLGGMHFFNLYVFSRMRKRSRANSSLDVSFANPATRA